MKLYCEVCFEPSLVKLMWCGLKVQELNCFSVYREAPTGLLSNPVSLHPSSNPPAASAKKSVKVSRLPNLFLSENREKEDSTSTCGSTHELFNQETFCSCLKLPWRFCATRGAVLNSLTLTLTPSQLHAFMTYTQLYQPPSNK